MAFGSAVARLNSLPFGSGIGSNVRPVVAENSELFNELLRRFEIPLIQYATRIIGDRERARDVVQETFAQLQPRLAEGLDHTSAKWLFSVCRNRALNVCRKERRMAYLDENVLDCRDNEELSPSKRLEEKEARRFLLEIVATLPVRQQEVLQLKFQDGLSYEEIGAITNLSVSNVGVLIHTALRKLRARFAGIAKDFLHFPNDI